jgi:hypothetical protein
MDLGLLLIIVGGVLVGWGLLSVIERLERGSSPRED